MALEVFKLFGSIMVDNDKANKSIKKTGEEAEGTGNKFVKLGELAKKAATVVGTVFTVKAIADFGKTCISAAEALEQTMKKTNTIFGESAGVVEEWALANERTFGLGSGTIQGFIKDIKSKELTSGHLKNITTILNSVGAFEDYYIPVFDGEKNIEFDTIQGINEIGSH